MWTLPLPGQKCGLAWAGPELLALWLGLGGCVSLFLTFLSLDRPLFMPVSILQKGVTRGPCPCGVSLVSLGKEGAQWSGGRQLWEWKQLEAEGPGSRSLSAPVLQPQSLAGKRGEREERDWHWVWGKSPEFSGARF